MCKHPTLILEGATPHPPRRHDDRRSNFFLALSRVSGNVGWYVQRRRFDFACGAICIVAFALAIGTSSPRDAGYAPIVKALVISAVRG